MIFSTETIAKCTESSVLATVSSHLFPSSKSASRSTVCDFSLAVQGGGFALILSCVVTLILEEFTRVSARVVDSFDAVDGLLISRFRVSLLVVAY